MSASAPFESLTAAFDAWFETPLSGLPPAILEDQKAICDGSRFVLPGRNRDKPISN